MDWPNNRNETRSFLFVINLLNSSDLLHPLSRVVAITDLLQILFQLTVYNLWIHWTQNRDQTRRFLFVMNFLNRDNLLLLLSGVVAVTDFRQFFFKLSTCDWLNDAYSRGFAFNQSQMIPTKLKKHLKQICYCYDAREQKQQIIPISITSDTF